MTGSPKSSTFHIDSTFFFHLFSKIPGNKCHKFVNFFFTKTFFKLTVCSHEINVCNFARKTYWPFQTFYFSEFWKSFLVCYLLIICWGNEGYIRNGKKNWRRKNQATNHFSKTSGSLKRKHSWNILL